MPISPPYRHSPAADRNKGPILDVLHDVLGASGHALEIASGTGQHIAHFAAGLPGWRWQPSDQAEAPDALTALDADIGFYCQQEGADGARVQPAIALDVLITPWPTMGRFNAIYCANMLHIAPWACCAALFQGAAQQLQADGLLITYGPYFEADRNVPPAAGNVAFDADLRARDPQWGIRQLADVEREAEAAGLHLQRRFELPANNLCLVFGR